MSGHQSLLATLLVLLVVTAGCATSGIQTPAQDDNVVNQETDTPTDSPTTTPMPSPSGEGQSTNITFRNTTENKLEEINQTLQNYYIDIASNRTEAKQIAAASARKTCSNFAPINRSLFTDPSAVQSRSRILSHAAEVANAHSEGQYVSPRQLRSIAGKAGTMAKYTTMIGPWNQYYQAACAYNQSKPETVENYYIASGALLFELSLMQYQVYYKTSFKTVQMMSHSRTFRAIQSTFGDNVLSLSMSISHWVARGGFETVPKILREKAIKGNLSISSVNLTSVNNSVDDIGNAGENLTEMVSNCHSKVTSSNDSSGGGLLSKGKDFLNSGKDLVEDVISQQNISNVIQNVENIDAENLSKDTITSIQNCIAEKQNKSR